MVSISSCCKPNRSGKRRGMFTSVGVITPSPPLIQAEQCLVLTPSGFSTHPCHRMNRTNDLHSGHPEYGSSCNTHPRQSRSSECVEPHPVIAQRPSLTLHHLMKPPSPHDLISQGSHSCWVWRLGSPVSRGRCSLSQICLGSLSLWCVG